LCNGRASAPENGDDGVAFLPDLENMSHNSSVAQHQAGGIMITAYGTLLQFMVSAAAIIVLIQAAGAQRYVWMSLFLLAACLFNQWYLLNSRIEVLWRRVFSRCFYFSFLSSSYSLKHNYRLLR
jgi:hypothetical protein